MFSRNFTKSTESKNGVRSLDSWKPTTTSQAGTASNVGSAITTTSKAVSRETSGPRRRNSSWSNCTQNMAIVGLTSLSSSREGTFYMIKTLELRQKYAVLQNEEVSTAVKSF